MARLPTDQREAVHLHHLKKLRLSETARAMSRSTTSVAGLIRRGLKTLRTRLQEGE
jgi:RNA polymerase sigma-70 factor (ECF subfamily)